MQELLVAEAGPNISNINARISTRGDGCARMEGIQKMEQNLAAATRAEMCNEGTIRREAGDNGVIVYTIRGARQDSSTSAIYPMRAARHL